MGLNAKYRVHELSKDLNIKSVDLLNLLTEYFGESKNNHMTALTEKELDFLFDYYTQKGQLASIAEYFRAYEIKEKPKAEEPKKEAKAAVKQNAPEKNAPKQTEQKRPKQENKEKKPAVPQKPHTQEKKVVPSLLQDKPNVPNAQKKPKNVRPEQKPQDNLVRPQMKHNDAERVEIVSEAKEDLNGRNVKVVDTRTPISVNLNKYDPRLDDIAGEKANRDFGHSKQKIKNKNKRQQMSKKEDEQAKLKRLEQYERDKKKHLQNIVLPEQISVSDLAAKLRMTNAQVVQKLVLLGIMAGASQVIDYDTAALVAEELGATVTKEVVVTIEDRLIDDTQDEEDALEKRCPVVVVMGHVDHGKTSLLDAIRHTNVVKGEAGGITQHIGAYQIKVNDQPMTFLDTPGHAAFTSMRARGAQVTDIVILVVAGDDGIMPQTVEAINHAKAAGVPIIVAINKMDKPDSDANRVMQSLTEYELVPEEWGGDVICVPVSALTRQGIDQLLEMVQLVADMKDLKANPNRDAKGTVIEAKLDKGRGAVATVLVQNGTLHTGDVIVAGTSVGRVRVMINDKGERVKVAIPSTPVEIVGLAEVPAAGDLFYAVKDEKMARELVEQRKFAQKEESFKDKANVSLDELFSQINDGSIKDLNLIIKADVQGSVEAVRTSLEKLSNEEVRIRVIHNAVGAITESDVMLASASNAIIIGFNVRPDGNVRNMAERDGIEIRLYRIIYDCIEEIKSAMKGLLAPKFKENVLGHAEVRQTFRVSGVGTIAGSYVKDGVIRRSAEVRLVRDGIVVFEGKIDSLKRFKDDAKEVAEGYECGIGLERYNDLKEGDIIEAFVMEEIKD